MDAADDATVGDAHRTRAAWAIAPGIAGGLVVLVVGEAGAGHTGALGSEPDRP